MEPGKLEAIVGAEQLHLIPVIIVQGPETWRVGKQAARQGPGPFWNGAMTLPWVDVVVMQVRITAVQKPSIVGCDSYPTMAPRVPDQRDQQDFR